LYYHESACVTYRGHPCARETLLNVDENAVNFAEYFRQYGSPQSMMMSGVRRGLGLAAGLK